MNAPTNTPGALSAQARKPQLLEMSQVLADLTAASISPVEVDGAWFVALPRDYSHTNITAMVEAAQPAPARLKGTVQLCALDSLVQYCKDQADATDGADASATVHGYIYADPDATTITAVFNDQRGAQPGWRDQRAVFKAELTPEFARWKAKNAQPMGQTEFAEFIEDNLQDITEPAAQQLLDVATTIQAKADINFSSAKRLQDGQTQLGYTETINATAGANGALQIPKEFALGLRIFKNGEGYRLTARLKYRLANGAVKFWYELNRPERAIEDAFAGYVETVSKESGFTVLIGKP